MLTLQQELLVAGGWNLAQCQIRALEFTLMTNLSVTDETQGVPVL